VRTKLGSLAEPGGIQTGPFGSQLHAHEYSETGVPVVMPQDLGENVISTESVARVPEEIADRLDRHRLRTGDIVYSRRGDITKRAWVLPSQVGWLCGTGCLRVRLNPALADSRFVSYALGLPETRTWLTNHAVGATMPNLNTSILSEVPVDVPDLATQTAIADVLGALDDKIAANDREIRLLDELTHALTLAALVRGQRQFALKDFAELTMGSSPTGETLSEDASGVAFHQGVRDFGVRQPTDRIFTSAPVRMARAGDVLISVRAPVGRLNRAAADLCIGRGLAAARTRHCSGATLYNLLRAAPDLWEAHGSDGTVFASISRPQLENLPIGVPDELDQLDVRLTVLEGRVDQLAAESSRLAATRDVLLPELMSGRLTIRTLEDSVR